MNIPSPVSSLQNPLLTILLVEDEPDVREVTRNALQQGGYRVLVADGPEAATSLATAEEQIDLLLTDLVMPGVNGLVLAERLGCLRPGLITVLMSGYAAHDLSTPPFLSSSFFYIQKPFSLETLRRTIRGAFETSGGHLVR